MAKGAGRVLSWARVSRARCVLQIKWSGTEGVLIHHQIGHGHFGDVFLATDEVTGESLVVKVLHPVKRDKIKREVRFLELLKGGVNIVGLRSCIKVPLSRQKCIAFEFVSSPDFKDSYPLFTDLQIRYYIYELVRGLDYTHSRGIIHRDIKPLNVLIDPAAHKVRIIDWGLAEFYVGGVPIRKWPGTRCYKSPELLLNYEYYDYSVDIWALGCMFGGMILFRHPLFRGRHTNANQVASIVKSLGTDDFVSYLNRYKIKLPSDVRKEIRRCKPRPWQSYVTAECAHLAGPEALDLLARMLAYDHYERITAAEALLHPYFDPVRNGRPF